MEDRIIIIGSGAAGLRAAIELAKNDQKSWLISDMPSERAQSVMAEGGINAALYTENDSYELHAEETYQAGRSKKRPDRMGMWLHGKEMWCLCDADQRISISRMQYIFKRCSEKRKDQTRTI